MIRSVVLGLCTLVFSSLGWGGEAVYRVYGERPADVTANGFVQTVVKAQEGGWNVSVTTSLSPIGARERRTPRRIPDSFLGVPRGFDLPSEVELRVARETEQWKRATGILEWVAGALRLDTESAVAQDALSVLDRGSGRCSGIANAAVGLLRAAGIPARTVSGVLAGRERTVAHRWLECRLPGAGWVPSDPTLGLWIVSPRHIAYMTPLGRVPRVHAVTVREESVRDLPRRRGWPYRPNRGAQLRCRLEDVNATALAVVVGPGQDRRYAVLDPEASFDSLLPGRWSVRVVAANRVVRSFGVLLHEGDNHSVTVPSNRLGAGS